MYAVLSMQIKMNALGEKTADAPLDPNNGCFANPSKTFNLAMRKIHQRNANPWQQLLKALP